MRYSIEPRRYGYGFLSFAKNVGTLATKVAKNVSSKYCQKLLDSAKKSTTNAIKTDAKRAIQKTAKATGNLICNHIVDKITKASRELHSKESSKELHPQNNLNQANN